jgi:hypothetical protein
VDSRDSEPHLNNNPADSKDFSLPPHNRLRTLLLFYLLTSNSKPFMALAVRHLRVTASKVSAVPLNNSPYKPTRLSLVVLEPSFID